MSLKRWMVTTAWVIVGWGTTMPVLAETKLDAIARSAISENASESATAIAALRARGPQGIQTFLQAYPQVVSGETVGSKQTPQPDRSSQQQQLRSILDRICQQKDCHASQLYWYTNLDEAKAAAKAAGKPILSLRLLGRLDEDLSCANSRFFRISLYPNAAISQWLRDRFILHWQTVRPVPTVTIDFGDGRKLQRTLTGNSIHYVLDAEGNIVDALPGLYGPQAFLNRLKQAENVAQAAMKLKGPEGDSRTILPGLDRGSPRQDFLRQYYRDRLATIQTKWTADLSKLGIPAPAGLRDIPNRVPTAEEAAQLALSKAQIERPLLFQISGNQDALLQITDEKAWKKIAELHGQEALLDRNSQQLMRSKKQSWRTTAGFANDPMMEAVRKFEALMALDTVRNEYLLQPKIYAWLIDSPSHTLESLNEQVYSQLFLTPSSDPWLGLAPDDDYTAIEDDGLTP